MPGHLERLPTRVWRGELLGRVRAQLPVVGELGERDQVWWPRG